MLTTITPATPFGQPGITGVTLLLMFLLVGVLVARELAPRGSDARAYQVLTVGVIPLLIGFAVILYVAVAGATG